MKLSAIVTMILLLSACVQQELTQNQCVVGHGSGFVGTTGNQEHITVAENGSPCGVELAGQHRGWGQFALGGRIESPPVHGTASIRDTAYATQNAITVAGKAVNVAYGTLSNIKLADTP